MFVAAHALSAPDDKPSKAYKYLDYAGLHNRLVQLAKEHPDLLKLTTAQKAFGLPSVGKCQALSTSKQDSNDGDPKHSVEPCQIWIATLTNHSTLASDPLRPEILVSGEVHGDEIVGPHAVLAYIEHVIDQAVNKKDAYARFILDHRAITLLPTTNAIGFNNRERGERPSEREAAIDPNRDFAFDQEPQKCMQTVAARALNELFRTHLFRILVTFHGGTNVVAYEWGDMTHCKGPVCSKAPDHAIMDALGKRMSDYAGSAPGSDAKYPVGDMGKLVYPVHGGMEDWAYGASWSGQAVTCTPPKTAALPTYPPEKTTYNAGSHRCVTFLVETSRHKQPSEILLGTSDDVRQQAVPGDGHIPRNIRLLTAAVDAAHPYILLNAAPVELDRAKIVWHVGGAFSVQGSALMWSTSNSGRHEHVGSLPHMHGVSHSQKIESVVPLFPSPGDASELFDKTPTLRRGHSMYVRIAAIVDAAMSDQVDGAAPAVPPQSHLLGARSDDAWDYSVSEPNADLAGGARRKVSIKGASVIYSDTLRVDISKNGAMTFTIDNSLKWGPEDEKTHTGAELVAPRDDIMVPLLLGKKVPPSYSDAGGEIPANTPRNGTAANSKPAGNHASPDNYVSGVIGVVVLLVVTVAILLRIRWYRNRSNVPKSLPLSPVDDDDEALGSIDSANEVLDEDVHEPLRPMDDHDIVVTPVGIQSQSRASAP